MPKMHVTPKEAAALTAKRKRDKAWNAAVTAALAPIKRRLKGADALDSALLHSIANDLRKLIR
jgi:hypothetical protein